MRLTAFELPNKGLRLCNGSVIGVGVRLSACKSHKIQKTVKLSLAISRVLSKGTGAQVDDIPRLVCRPARLRASHPQRRPSRRSVTTAYFRFAPPESSGCTNIIAGNSDAGTLTAHALAMLAKHNAANATKATRHIRFAMSASILRSSLGLQLQRSAWR
jgi:hypothetical protein